MSYPDPPHLVRKIEVQVRIAVFSFTNRICFRNQMAFVAIAQYHPVGPQLLLPVYLAFSCDF